MGVEKIEIDVSGMTIKEIMQEYDCKRTWAKALRKRGYITKKTKHMAIINDLSVFDVKLAYEAAEVAFWRKFYHRFKNPLDHFDDMKQAAVLRMIECSADIEGKNTPFSYMAKIATNEMHGYLKRMDIYGSYLSKKMASFEENLEGNGIYAIA